MAMKPVIEIEWNIEEITPNALTPIGACTWIGACWIDVSCGIGLNVSCGGGCGGGPIESCGTPVFPMSAPIVNN